MEKVVSNRSVTEQEGIIIISEGKETPSYWPLACCNYGFGIFI